MTNAIKHPQQAEPYIAWRRINTTGCYTVAEAGRHGRTVAIVYEERDIPTIEHAPRMRALLRKLEEVALPADLAAELGQLMSDLQSEA